MDRKVSIIYDTLNDLKIDPDVVGGMIVKTLGNESIGDGEGYIYKVYDPSMGKVYDPTKHVKLEKPNVFAEKVKDSYLYDMADEMREDIDELKASGQAVDLTKFTITHQTLTDMKGDGSLRAGRFVKTLGEEEVGDGGGATYKIVDHDPTTAYQDWEIPIASGNIVAVKIVDSETTKTTNENKDDIEDIKETLNSGYLRVYNTLGELSADEDVVAGMVVKTLGRIAAGDGEGRTYKIFDENSGVPFDPIKDIPMAREGTFADPINDVEFYDEIGALTDLVAAHSTSINNLTLSTQQLTNRVNTINQTVSAQGSSISLLNDSVSNILDQLNTITEKYILNLGDEYDITFIQYSNLVNSIIVGTYVAPEPEPEPEPDPEPTPDDNPDENTDNTDNTEDPITGADGDDTDNGDDGGLEPTEPTDDEGDDPDPTPDPDPDPEPEPPAGYEVSEEDGVVTITFDTEYSRWMVPSDLSKVDDDTEIYFGDNVSVKRHAETIIIPPEEEGDEPTEITKVYVIFTITKVATRRVYQYV